MSSILTNNAATTALATLRGVNRNLNETQDRISTGLSIRSGKENAAYFSISSKMKGDSGMYKSINEGLTLTKNSIATARKGAEKVKELTKEFVERVAFAQNDGGDKESVQKELTELAARVATVIDQASFNGNDLVTSSSTVTVVTGISRSSGAFSTTTITFDKVDLNAIHSVLSAQAAALSKDSTVAQMQTMLSTVNDALEDAIAAATDLGVAEKSVETQKDFLTSLSEELDSGTGALIEADMESEAARLQALQVQSQLATQSLSIANQAPQNLMSLFR